MDATPATHRRVTDRAMRHTRIRISDVCRGWDPSRQRPPQGVLTPVTRPACSGRLRPMAVRTEVRDSPSSSGKAPRAAATNHARCGLRPSIAPFHGRPVRPRPPVEAAVLAALTACYARKRSPARRSVAQSPAPRADPWCVTALRARRPGARHLSCERGRRPAPPARRLWPPSPGCSRSGPGTRMLRRRP